MTLAVAHSNIVCLRYLIEHGPETIASQMKALLFAVKIQNIDVCKVLLRESKLNPNFADKDGMTPLRWAVAKGYKSVCKELLIGGARDDVDQFGENIVFYAAKSNHVHILQLLQKANADFSIIYNKGLSATDKTNNLETIQFIQNVRNVQ